MWQMSLFITRKRFQRSCINLHMLHQVWKKWSCASCRKEQAGIFYDDNIFRNFKKMGGNWFALLARIMVYLHEIATFINVKCADQEDIWSSFGTTFVTLTDLKVDLYYFALIVVMHIWKQKRRCRKLCYILMSGNVLAQDGLGTESIYQKTTDAASIHHKVINDAGLEETTVFQKMIGNYYRR